MNYWYKPYVILINLLMQVHCKFATDLGERVLFSVSVSVLPVRATKSSLIKNKAALRVFSTTLTTCRDVYVQLLSKHVGRLYIHV